MNKIKQKRNSLLVTASVLIMISAIAHLAFGILLFVGTNQLIDVYGDTFNHTLLRLYAFFSVAVGCGDAVAGSLGISYAPKPSKANVCLVLGALTAFMPILGIAVTTLCGGMLHPIYLLIVLLPSALYIIGALQNRRLHRVAS